jgi:hypothetical protein
MIPWPPIISTSNKSDVDAALKKGLQSAISSQVPGAQDAQVKTSTHAKGIKIDILGVDDDTKVQLWRDHLKPALASLAKK